MDVAVIGLGLIGGSTMRALAAAGHRVYGYDTDPTTRATARNAATQVGPTARWEVAGSIADTVRGAELVIVAVPLPAVPAVFTELAGIGYTGLVTDVTSVKGPVLDLARGTLRARGLRLATYVGGHPMAGRETSGFPSSDATLFHDAAWVLCLEPDTPTGEWLGLATLFASLGARIVPSTADEHDRAVAAVSHVPHIVASAVAAGAAGDPLALALAAGSFRDGTRVAASRPELVAAMCGGNAEAVRAALDLVLDQLDAARAALDTDDPIRSLAAWLAPGAATRLAWPPRAGQTTRLPADPEVLLRLGRVGGWITEVAPDRRTVVAVRPA